MKKPEVIHPENVPEYYFKEGCHIAELLNREDHPELSIARARVAPGVSTRRHRLLGTQERYIIQSGEGIVHIGNLPPGQVKAGSVVYIPENCEQSITNTGKADLVFIALCTPRFIAEAYVDLEIDTSQD